MPKANSAWRLTHSNVRGTIHHSRFNFEGNLSSSHKKTAAISSDNVCGRTPQPGAETAAPHTATMPATYGFASHREKARYIVAALMAPKVTISPPQPAAR